MSHSRIPATSIVDPNYVPLPQSIRKETFRQQRASEHGEQSLFPELEDDFLAALREENLRIGIDRKQKVMENRGLALETLQASLMGGEVTGKPRDIVLPSRREIRFQPDVLNPNYVDPSRPTWGSTATEVKSVLAGNGMSLRSGQDAKYALFLACAINGDDMMGFTHTPDNRASVDYATFVLKRDFVMRNRRVDGKIKSVRESVKPPTSPDALSAYVANNIHSGLVLPHFMVLGLRQHAISNKRFKWVPKNYSGVVSNYLANPLDIPAEYGVPMSLRTALIEGNISNDELVKLVSDSYKVLRADNEWLPEDILPEMREMYKGVERKVIDVPEMYFKTANGDVPIKSFPYVKYEHPDDQLWAGVFGEQYATILTQSGIEDMYTTEKLARNGIIIEPDNVVELNPFDPLLVEGTGTTGPTNFNANPF